MATIIRFGASRGLNIEQLAEWTYSERAPKQAQTKRAAGASAGSRHGAGDPGSAEAAGELEPEQDLSAMIPVITLTFTGGHSMEFEGDEAAALHRYFRTVGSSLT